MGKAPIGAFLFRPAYNLTQITINCNILQAHSILKEAIMTSVNSENLPNLLTELIRQTCGYWIRDQIPLSVGSMYFRGFADHAENCHKCRPLLIQILEDYWGKGHFLVNEMIQAHRNDSYRP